MYLQQWRRHSVQVYKSVVRLLWLSMLKHQVVHMNFLNGMGSCSNPRKSSRVSGKQFMINGSIQH